MNYDAAVDWSSLISLLLFFGLFVVILWRAYRPGRAKEMTHMARIPLDSE